jgi:hypothetical protein
LPKGKDLAKEKRKFLSKDKGLASIKRQRFSQEKIEVLPSCKGLTKKKKNFC